MDIKNFNLSLKKAEKNLSLLQKSNSSGIKNGLNELSNILPFFKEKKWFKIFDTIESIIKFLNKLSSTNISVAGATKEIKRILNFLHDLGDITDKATENSLLKDKTLRTNLDFFKFEEPKDKNKAERKKTNTVPDVSFDNMETDLSSDPELIKIFIDEFNELISEIEVDLIPLEKDPGNNELIAKIFRAVHTIKGNSATIKLTQMNKLTHAFETLLSKVRDDEVDIFTTTIDVFFESLDILKILIERAEIGDAGLDVDIEAVLRRLENEQNRKIKIDRRLEERRIEDRRIDKEVSKDKISILYKAETTMKVNMSKLDSLLNWAGELHLNWLRERETFKEMGRIFHNYKDFRNFFLDNINKTINSAFELKNESSKTELQEFDFFSESEARLEALGDKLKRFRETLDEITNTTGHVSNEIRANLINIRMVPLSGLFNHLPRMVRELAKKFSKLVSLNITGGEVEIDKKILEEMGDPLMHIVRNAIDHGIETPDIRKSKGKMELGTLNISAKRFGNKIQLEIADDGAGFNLNKIREKAIKKGLFSRNEINKISDSEIIKFILLPGFSTKEEITAVSGRGVGMDVVSRNISRLKGSIDLFVNKKGGSTFLIQLPLSLAIDKVLFIKVGKEKYAIPTGIISDVDKVPRNLIEKIGDKYTYFKNNSAFHLFFLAHLFGINGQEKIDQDEIKKSVPIIINNEMKMAIAVDKLLGTEEIIIRPLADELSGMKSFIGVTIDSQGKIVLIPNMQQIMETANAK